MKWEGDVSISIGSHGAPVGKCRRSFSPMYSSVLDAGLTRGVSVSEVRCVKPLKILNDVSCRFVSS